MVQKVAVHSPWVQVSRHSAAGANRPSDNPSLDDRELCLIGETPRTFAARDAMRRGAATEANVIDTVEAIEAMVYRSRDVSSHLGTRL